MTRKRTGPPPNPQSKRQRGVDRHASPRVVFHLEPALLDALHAYRGRFPYPPSAAEVCREALRRFLADQDDGGCA